MASLVRIDSITSSQFRHTICSEQKFVLIQHYQAGIGSREQPIRNRVRLSLGANSSLPSHQLGEDQTDSAADTLRGENKDESYL